MNYFIKAAKGWEITRRSWKVLEENKQLLIFPILSGVSLLLIVMPFFLSGYTIATSPHRVFSYRYYGYAFIFYLFNYFILIFFNTALTHCVRAFFLGKSISIKDGFQAGIKNLGVIFTWAFFAATIGTLLRILFNNIGIAGKVCTGIINGFFGIATYLVMPVVVSEKLGPFAAFKRSVSLLQSTWGQSVHVGFNFIFIQLIAVVFIAIIAITIGTVTIVFAGCLVALFGIIMLLAVVSSARIVFITALYLESMQMPVKNFERNFMEDLFVA